MPNLSSLLRRANWLARHALHQSARSDREEIWQLRRLRIASPGTPGIVRWQGAPLHYADGPAVYGQLQEIFAQGVYDFASAHPAPRILDCGAHVGIAVMRWRTLFPQADITAFEADPSIAECLRRNLAARGDRATQVHAAAAWIADTQIGFHQTGADNGCITETASQTVSGRDLATFCREPVDLLKLDIEGAEERVLIHLDETGALRRVRRFVCEWHQWTPSAPTLHAALARLVAAGFAYRIASAACLGGSTSPVFPCLGWHGNHIMVYAWQPSLTSSA